MSSSSSAPKPLVPPPAVTTEDRRDKVMRDLKLALVDEMELRRSGGFNPYDSREGRTHTDRWGRRRR